MLNRRDVLVSGLATLGLAWSKAAADEATDGAQFLPPEFQPRVVPIQAGLPPVRSTSTLMFDPGV